MNMPKRLVPTLTLSLLCAGASHAAALTVVPGSSSAYLYFPGSGDSAGKTMLKVEKRGDFQGYSIKYAVDGAAATELCSKTDESCEVSLPAAEVTLSIDGTFAPGLRIGAAKWMGDCSVTGVRATCTLVIDPSENQVVRVEAACDGSQASIVNYKGQDVLCVGRANTGTEWLLAAHMAYGAAVTSGTVKQVCGNNNEQDGRINRNTLASAASGCKSPAVDYCTALNHAGLGQGAWYLPASGEMRGLRSPAPAAMNNARFWSSTEADKKKAYAVSVTSSGVVGSPSSLKKYKTDSKYLSSPLCFTRVSEG